MKKSKFSETQVAFILKRAEDGTAVDKVSQGLGSRAPCFEISARNTSG